MTKENMGFVEAVSATISSNASHVCVGLDTDYDHIPQHLKDNHSVTEALVLFNKAIIDATHDITAVYKANVSFYAGFGLEGLDALRKTTAYLHEMYPDMKIIADCKRSEMVRSAELAAREIYDQFGFDAMIVTPWFGEDTIAPYRSYKDKAVFVLCHDSNPSAGQVQDLELADGRRVYEAVTSLVNEWNTSGNVLMEGPLTYPQTLRRIVDLAENDEFFLVAGLGAQGGNIEDLALFKDRHGFIVNASRSIIFASSGEDFAQKAREVVISYNHQIAAVLTA